MQQWFVLLFLWDIKEINLRKLRLKKKKVCAVYVFQIFKETKFEKKSSKFNHNL